MSEPPAVAVCVVTYNSAADLPGCMASLAALTHRPLELVIVDCGSHDDSVEVAHQTSRELAPAQVIPLGENLGFTGGMNAALAASRAPFVLTLNADARPEADFVERLLARMQFHGGVAVGAVAGRLVRPVGSEEEPPQLDACGMRLSPSWRHFDRASDEIDRGQLLRPERVFGATGAASLFRREALEDVADDGDVFLPEFHSFREDAELCFRLQERGWAVLYEPRARAIHRRSVLPRRRTEIPAAVNFHSLKNRYLLRFYHQTWSNLLLTLIPAVTRDLLALVWVILRERTSLAAYSWLWRNRALIAARSRRIRRRRTSSAASLNRWFFRQAAPVSQRQSRKLEPRS